MGETEKYRPSFHFTPDSMWMNDPNGMVYHKGVYHLFYQYNPDSTVWGPMHWGHAISQDLIHWERLPVALYPDSLGCIFSGSAVIDKKNTSGLGTLEMPPMVAVYTYHNMAAERAGRNDYQTQAIAYSLDEGRTWIKYKGNPVIKNPGVRDFRDPKVRWSKEYQKWIMALAVKNKVSFYSSPNLRDWIHESDFGQNHGAHGGVWECPELFPIRLEGTPEEKWVLLVSLSPGGPNGGSATQYFVGDFDGHTFTTTQTTTQWVDYGTDNYAGVTWSNTGDEKIFLGWMSNWLYANQVPTQKWRSAMTVPRKLRLFKDKDGYSLTGFPVEALKAIKKDEKTIHKDSEFELHSAAWIHLKLQHAGNNSITLKNTQQEQLVIRWDEKAQAILVDRTDAGLHLFSKDFAKVITVRHTFPQNKAFELDILLDQASIEVFVNKGKTQITALVFPTTPYTILDYTTTGNNPEQAQLTVSEIQSIWE